MHIFSLSVLFLLCINLVSRCADVVPGRRASEDISCAKSEDSELIPQLIIYELKGGNNDLIGIETRLLKSIVANSVRLSPDQSHNQKLNDVMECLFHDLDSKQRKLVVKALIENEKVISRASATLNAPATRFAEKVEEKDLGWLTERAALGTIHHIYAALITKLASNPELAFRLYEKYQITDAVGNDIVDKMDKDPICAIIRKRLAKHTELPSYGEIKSVFCDKKEHPTKLFVNMRWGAIVYDIQKKELSKKTNTSKNSRILSVSCNRPCTHAFLLAHYCLMLQDMQIGQQTELSFRRDPFVGESINEDNVIISAGFNVAGSELFIRYKDSIVIYDLLTKQAKEISVLDGSIGNVRYGEDNQLFIETKDDDLIVYDTCSDQQRVIIPALEDLPDKPRVIWNGAATQAILNVNKKWILYDVATEQKKEIFGWLHFIESIQYCDNDTKLLIKTSDSLHEYDLKTAQQKIIVKECNGQHFIYNNNNLLVIDEQWRALTNHNFFKVIDYPDISLSNLNMAQMRLLKEATDCWQVDRPHQLKEACHKKVYESLPNWLQVSQLFAME